MKKKNAGFTVEQPMGFLECNGQLRQVFQNMKCENAIEISIQEVKPLLALRFDEL